MRKLLAIPLALIVSLIVYGLINGVVLDKRLTLGLIGDAIIKKRAYAEANPPPPPRLFVVGGSNVFYSYRCSEIGSVVGRRCINYGTSLDIGMAYSFELVGRDAKPGDTVVLAFEYYSYLAPLDSLRTGLAHPIRMTHDMASIPSLDWKTSARAFFQFDARYEADAFLESSLSLLGIRRLISLDRISDAGDIVGMTAALAAPYHARLASTDFEVRRGEKTFNVSSDARQVIADNVSKLQSRGINVIATLPTLMAGSGVDKKVVDAVTGLFDNLKVPFVALPNDHVYPNDCFFDTYYHLNEECQINHSRAFAGILKPALAQP